LKCGSVRNIGVEYGGYGEYGEYGGYGEYGN